ncbi:N-acyl phosphatidylethanolamine phospholipase D [Monoraphidium neglectum]|uniref:N-acyl phosphatidylethanolamine phospholipase D n=1 Tax=Monoraphidium neglectum TaxID=145388 RepID=A0A0D2MY04_9CHLO|nr:N-acyl phosphatidylethanolamine phospholipase D [Monoraphidium neglectum]KIZ07365.1 N-acyl phosphatidylethanolamine phospholipase D [Monoraphidium neglectum]|eukprot:XP_013906384.1 N-acyl phosphatidylethanolamine phospholipase D [Monoraphidium neglectum]
MTGITAASLRGADGRFDNPWPTWKGDKSLWDLREFAKQMRELRAPNYGYLSYKRQPTLADMSAAFPLRAPDYDALSSPDPAAVSALWVGHASVLVQMEGLTLWTDPVLADRASPLPFVGPRRAVPPALSPEDPWLPKVDAILISHNHYDHLCAPSVKRLHRRYGDDLVWYVPLGLAEWFAARGIKNVKELGWWEQAQHPGSKVQLVLTPAQHWSARGIMDRRKTLWGGWAALGERSRFWFAGDTGYAPVFKEIGQRLGPFDLSAIPIGAYEPRAFMAPQHVGPDEAVTIHRDVRSRRSIAIHCCTFHLTLEPLDEPPALLAREAAARGLADDEFVCLQHGAMMTVKDGAVVNSPLQRLPLPRPATDAGEQQQPQPQQAAASRGVGLAASDEL